MPADRPDCRTSCRGQRRCRRCTPQTWNNCSSKARSTLRHPGRHLITDGRKYGLTSDRLIGVQIVLADGRLVHCDDAREGDLFWALRGAGAGNFGVVTSLVFRAVPAPDTTNFHLAWPFGNAGAVLEAWQGWGTGGARRARRESERNRTRRGRRRRGADPGVGRADVLLPDVAVLGRIGVLRRTAMGLGELRAGSGTRRVPRAGLHAVGWRVQTACDPMPPPSSIAASSSNSSDRRPSRRAVLHDFGGIDSWASIDFLHRLGWEFVGGEQVLWPSSLARGPYGWVQVATFVITGLLIVVLAIALRDQLPRKRASSFAILLLGLLGVALILAAFRVDTPMLRAGNPDMWHGCIHRIASLLIIRWGCACAVDDGSCYAG
jgi:Protein of unknown function (DUF998)